MEVTLREECGVKFSVQLITVIFLDTVSFITIFISR